MTTLSKLAESLAYSFGKDKDELFIDQLKDRILHFRNIAIKREYEKTNLYAQSLTYTIFCIPVESVEDNPCGEGVVCVGRTPIIPKPLILKYSEPFISVSNTLISGKKRNISYIVPEALEYLQYRRFTGDKPHCTYINDRLYFVNTTVKEINIRALWDNPIEAKKFNDNIGCQQSNDNFLDDDLIIDDLLAGIITTFITNASTSQK